MINKIEDSNIIKYGTHKIIVNRRIIDKAIRKVVRVISIQTVELNHIISKYLEYNDSIDIKVRNAFKKDLSLSLLKSYSSFKIYRTRNNTITTKKTDESYSRHS